MSGILDKNFLGALSVLFAAAAYGVYGWQTARGEVRPHPLSWGIFGVVTGTGFWVQWNENAGAGSWVTAATAAICFLLCALSIGRGERRFPWYEWAFAFLAVLVFAFYLTFTWSVTTRILVAASVPVEGVAFLQHNAATISAICVTVVDLLGYIPTIFKLLRRPYSDSVWSFALNGIKFIPALYAMEATSIATVLYPRALVVANLFVAFLLLIWRQIVGKTNKKAKAAV